VQFLEALPTEEQTGVLQQTSWWNCQSIISKWKAQIPWEVGYLFKKQQQKPLFKLHR